MNKPAAKEPSMDEILSSIRQIIADDDDSVAPRRPSLQIAPDPMEATPASGLSAFDSEPLELSSAQIVPETEDNEDGDVGFDALLADAQAETASFAEKPANLVDPDDISFSPADNQPSIPRNAAPELELPRFDPAPFEAAQEAEAEPEVEAEYVPEPELEAAPVFSVARNNEDHVDAPSEEPEQVRSSIAAVSPMPDSKLSSDIAEGLLESTTKAAVRNSMEKFGAAKIGAIKSPGVGNGDLTLESMVRDMLRPMLKEWLDENLPAVVERMVEKELARVARGD